MRRIMFILLLLLSGIANAGTVESLRRYRELAAKHGLTLVIDAEPENPLVIARHWPDKNEVHINILYPYWADPDKAQATAWARLENSSGHPDHIIHHEIGHALLVRAIGNAKSAALARTAVPLNWPTLEAEIGSYSLSNEFEFAAEVYAAKQCGRKLSKEILEHYETLWKP